MPTKTVNQRRHRISITLQIDVDCEPTTEAIEAAKTALSQLERFRIGAIEIPGYSRAAIRSLRAHAPYQLALRGELFWKKVEKSDKGCWLWHGKPNADGYGLYTRHGLLAHRMAYILTHGPIPGNLLVLHSCDVRHCVRPDHLRLGTHQDNMEDMRKRGRHGRLGRIYPLPQEQP